MKRYSLVLVSLAFFAYPFSAVAKVDDQIEAQELQALPWKINSNFFLEVEDFKGHRVNDERVFDKVSPAVQLGINKPDSKWSYFMEYKVSMRNYTTSYESMPTSYNRNRLQLQANRNLYKGNDGAFTMSFVYRKESNDVREGKPPKNAYHSYWLIPNGSYHFNKQLSFVFWDAGYYYDNTFSGPDINQWEWESEHGFQYQFNDNFKAKLMYYTDWTWNSSGNKTWEQNQIRGYFPTKINEEWNIQPYFRLFLSEKIYDPLTGATTNSADLGGLRLGLIVNYNFTSKVTLWSNVAWETTHWDKSKNSQVVQITYGDNNRLDFRLYSVGVTYSW
ncbi:OmpG family monomeric porin [Serratia sp. UGAL515B_01]|uniref:OmpG family monomeric porin n=1 Tax=Serratia sp. UGAL515B_01 TaxID=2986763 RepID=UPI002954C08F|nr:OmpG family monomeric porin [Serratia sp. UGAL515B_01]WON77355.1 OmpG family monomeric porin [Serratia sp. UGAL515B_01]